MVSVSVVGLQLVLKLATSGEADRKRSHGKVRMTLQVGETRKYVNVIVTHSVM